MTLPNRFQQPVSDLALLNAAIIHDGGGPPLPQEEDRQFLQATIAIATGKLLVQTDAPPARDLAAAWLASVDHDSPETFALLWDNFLAPHFARDDRRAISAEMARQRKEILRRGLLPARNAYLAQLRASLDTASFLTTASWRQSRTGDPRLDPSFLRMLESLKQFVRQTELARREGGGAPLSESAWAEKVWRFLENPDFGAWLHDGLRVHGADATTSVTPPRDPESNADDQPSLPAQTVRYFHLDTILAACGAPSPGAADIPLAGATLAPALAKLTPEEIHRVARVEVLLAAVAPGEPPLLPSTAYALPLLRMVQTALRLLLLSGRAKTSRKTQLAVCVLQRLEAYYAQYQAWSPRLQIPRLGKFPQDAVKKWSELLQTLETQGHAFLRQQPFKRQLSRALHVAITPNQSPLSQRLCASPSLLRQWTTERVGRGRRCRNDMYTELSLFGAKLRGRMAALAKALACEPLPPSVLDGANELQQAAREFADVCFGGREGDGDLSLAARANYVTSIQLEYTRLESRLAELLPLLTDPELRRRLDNVRCSAQRVVWTVEDVSDGFLRVRRNAGLRWLLCHRGHDRLRDVLSPE